MKIKLRRLHNNNAHVGRCYNNYRHDSSKSLYGYKNFRIRTDDYYGGWYVEEINTEKSKGSALNFLEKEDKWFSSIRGKSEDQNDIDLKKFSVQGIGSISSINVKI